MSGGIPLPIGSFGCILADPPWMLTAYSPKGEAKSPAAHYSCMSGDEIKALDFSFTGAPDCAMLMWATAPLLPMAIETMRSWGFIYKTAGSWAKQSRTGKRWTFGTGYIFRSAAEFYIVGARGRPRIRSRSVRNLIVAPVREHSRKPEAMHRLCETLFDGPYLELFARAPRSGWTVWGDQIDRFEASV